MLLCRRRHSHSITSTPEKVAHEFAWSWIVYSIAFVSQVAQIPPNVQTKAGDPQTELVRHFLIETTPKGVKLKGCSNEPVFGKYRHFPLWAQLNARNPWGWIDCCLRFAGSLAALVYQHSITPLALPCKLILPEPRKNHFHVSERLVTSSDKIGTKLLPLKGKKSALPKLERVKDEKGRLPSAVVQPFFCQNCSQQRTKKTHLKRKWKMAIILLFFFSWRDGTGSSGWRREQECPDQRSGASVPGRRLQRAVPQHSRHGIPHR